MITVAILINGNPLVARMASKGDGLHGALCEYHCDDGSSIWHNPADGAVGLAHKLLDKIKIYEPDVGKPDE